jgi:pantetheine-phosphate adenylyltransferase
VTTTALLPGRFDPVTNGHRDIAKRAARMFDKLIVAAADLKSNYLFTTEERVDLLRVALADLKNIEVTSFSGLTVEFARQVDATIIVRSMRGNTDFEYEFDMALMNKKMAPEIESVYMMASLEHLYVSGTRIREVSALGYDVSDLVPPHVFEALQRKYAERASRS